MTKKRLLTSSVDDERRFRRVDEELEGARRQEKEAGNSSDGSRSVGGNEAQDVAAVEAGNALDQIRWRRRPPQHFQPGINVRKTCLSLGQNELVLVPRKPFQPGLTFADMA